MKCPRCSKELRAVSVECAEVQACSNCEGIWFPGEALGQVTDHSVSDIKQTELKESLVADQLEKVDLDKEIHCPECQETMDRYTYSLVCPIVLDECSKHGVWLDDGELGTLMKHLTELEDRVVDRQNDLLNQRNLDLLQELSKKASFHSLPTKVLATINKVHARDRR